MSDLSSGDVIVNDTALPQGALAWGQQVENALGLGSTQVAGGAAGSPGGGGGPPGGGEPPGGDHVEDDTEELRARLLQRLRELVPQGATAETLVPGAAPQEMAPIFTTANALAVDIGRASREALDELEADVESLAPGIQRVRDAVAERRNVHDEIERNGQAVTGQGNTQDQKTRLSKARDRLGELLALPVSEQSNADANGALKSLREVADTVTQEEVKRSELVRLLDEAVPGTTAAAIVPGAVSEDLADVLEKKAQLAHEIGTAAGAGLSELGGRIDELRSAIGTVRLAVEKRRTEHDRIAEAAGQVTTVGFLEDQKTRLADARESLRLALEAPITDPRNKFADDALLKLQDLAKTVTDEMDSLGGEAGIGELCGAVGVDPTTYAALETAIGGRTATAGLLKAFPAAKVGDMAKALGGGIAGAKKLAELVSGFGSPAALTQTMTSLDPGGEKRLLALVTKGNLDAAGVTKLRDDLSPPLLGALMGTGDDPASAVALQKELGSNVKALQDLAAQGGFGAKPAALAALYTKGCGGDAKAFAKFCTDFDNPDDRAKLKGLVDGGGLGDAPDCLGELMSTGCGGDATKLKEIGASFADPVTGDARRKGLKRALTNGGLAGSEAKSPDGAVDPACLAQLFKHGGADQLANLVAGLDATACDNLAVALKRGGLGSEPEAFAELVDRGCGKGDPGKLGSLVAELNTAPTKLKGLDDLLKTGGFGTKDDKNAATGVKPECLAKLFELGCDGKPAELTKLLTGLDPTDRTNLKGLMQTAELGKHPDVIGPMFKEGCDGEPAKLKTLCTAFADPLTSTDSRDGLKRALSTGGLGGSVANPPDGAVDPACLAKLVKKSGGAQVAKLVAGLDPTACGNLAATLKRGGLGSEPDVFAELVEGGCDKGDPAKLTGLVTELNSNPAKLKGLDDLLKQGGFGTKDSAQAPTNIKPECLATLFSPGCDGKPAELTKLLVALSPADLANLKGLMTTGDLGKTPKVIGSMYKHGCIGDPDGADDGTKQPTVLKDMIGEFAGAVGAGQFKDLMDNGGLGEVGKEDRLGSLMRYACSSKNAPVARDGKVIKQFHTAFNGNMADLKTTIEAFETAPGSILEPGSPTQPGKAFRNIVNAPGHGNGLPNATQLRSKVFVPLQNRANLTGAAVPQPPPPKRLDLEGLLQNTASFELKPYPVGNVATTLGANLDFRIDHVMDRHTREFNAFQLGGSSKTTLYPRAVTDTVVQARLASTWGSIPNPLRGNRTGPPPPPVLPPTPKANPPADIYDLDGNYVCYPFGVAVPPGLPDGAGGQAKIGFNPHPTAAPPAIYIAQYFPVDDGSGANGTPGAGGLLTVHNTDMSAMRTALQ